MRYLDSRVSHHQEARAVRRKVDLALLAFAAGREVAIAVLDRATGREGTPNRRSSVGKRVGEECRYVK
jgi:hypothetical protein